MTLGGPWRDRAHSNLRSWKLQDDLAEMASALHMAKRTDRFHPGIHAVDNRSQLVHLNGPVHRLEGGAGPDRNAADTHLATEDVERVDRTLCTTKIANDVDLSARYCQLGAKETTLPLGLSCLAYECGTGSITPSGKGAIANSAVLTGGQAMAAKLEAVVDRSVSGEEPLRVPG